MTAYYNEFDPKAAAWLRELIRQGHIAPGDVDERSIEDVKPDDLRPYSQCHFFAGIGVWSYALRRAWWPDDRRVWTGSCPCQPFSSAGKGDGFADERHLWPHFHHLIRQCGPDVVFGEQVASKDGLAWLDLVQADLEGTGYAVGAVDTCAAGFGAPHIRQRLYWCADRLAHPEREQRIPLGLLGHREAYGEKSGWEATKPAGSGVALGLADGVSEGLERQPGHGDRGGEPGRIGALPPGPTPESSSIGGASPTNGHWGAADWLFCRDGKWRPVEPGAFPLAHRAAARVGRLRGYGNAIVAQAAQGFIEAYLETKHDTNDGRVRVTELSETATDMEDVFG